MSEHEHGPMCGCEDDADQPLFITLHLDDDSQLECMVLSIFDVGDQDYIALIPWHEDLEADEEDDETEVDVLLYRYKEEDGEPVLEDIEDDDEYAVVAETLSNMDPDNFELDDDDFEDMLNNLLDDEEDDA